MRKGIDVLGNEFEVNCMGCDVANHKLIPPGGYIYDDGFITVAADPEIPIIGFIVLGISKHIRSMNELSKEERTNVTEVLNRSIAVLKELNLANEVYLIQEETASHFHIWIVPVHDWMKGIGKGIIHMSKYIDYAN